MSWHTLNNYYVYTYFDNNQVPYYVGMGKGKPWSSVRREAQMKKQIHNGEL